METTTTIILGGVTLEASLRDGSKEDVKVRQLPIEQIQRWATLQGDEASLVELYCDKEDKERTSKLEAANALGARFTEMLRTADVEAALRLDAELEKVRARINQLSQRWSAQLLPESHDEIIRIGEDLNRPIFARWAESRRAAMSMMTGFEKAISNTSNSETSPPSAA